MSNANDSTEKRDGRMFHSHPFQVFLVGRLVLDDQTHPVDKQKQGNVTIF